MGKKYRSHTNYATKPLAEYSGHLRQLAQNLFGPIQARMTTGRAVQETGSYSVFSTSRPNFVVAKVFIYEVQKERPPLTNGTVYAFIRAYGPLTTKIWDGVIANTYSDLLDLMDRLTTVGVVDTDRFAFLKIGPETDLERLATFIAECSTL